MKIIINNSSIFKGGAEQVAISFINECKKFNLNEYYIFYCDNLEKQLDISKFPPNFIFYRIENRPGSSLKNYWRSIRVFKQIENKISPDCVISTGSHGYWRPKSPIVGGFNIPHYIYPDSPYFQKISLKKRIYWKCMKAVHMYFYSRLDAVVVQTDDVKDRLKKILASQAPIYTISNTVNGHFLEPEVFPKKLPEKTNGEIRLLTLSSYYPHKNIEIINRVVARLKEKGKSQFKFIVTLPDVKFQKVFGSLNGKMIHNVGPIPIKECPSLYEECDFMFLPTLLECFSASYAEAMLMKKPILTSDLEFAHTVCKNTAVYFDPEDPDDITDKIIELAGNKKKQEEMKERGFDLVKTYSNAEQRAGKLLSICQSVINKKRGGNQ